AGVERLSDLRFKSLELSDKMAGRISREAQFAAALQGLVTGLGGLPLVALDISALVVITLNGIQRTGQCYGYALDRPEDRPFLLAILMLAGARSLPERRDALAHLRDVRSWVLSRAIESAAIENVIKQLLNIAVLESIPGVGSVIGGAANLAFVRKALADGRRVFQERWLLESCGSAPMIEVLSSPSLAQENESCPRQLTVTKASRKLRS
ncbi:MAG: EcsC family protein, partial [Planctomycetales bacterium]